MKRYLLLLSAVFLVLSVRAQQLYQYIEQAYEKQYSYGDKCKDFFAYKIMDSSQTKSGKVYYLVLYVQGYKLKDGLLQECSSTFTPAVLEIPSDSVVPMLFLPAEGEDYSASIRKLFPPQLQTSAFEFYRLMDVDRAKHKTLHLARNYFSLIPVKIYYPADTEIYDSLYNAYVNGIAKNPADKVKFNYDLVYLPKTPDIKRQAALMAYKKFPPFGNPDNASIVYFKQVADTVYILINADVDGWAGVSYFLAKVRPIIEKTLYQFYDVHKVVWDKAPEDK